jgi:hypothetical protein
MMQIAKINLELIANYLAAAMLLECLAGSGIFELFKIYARHFEGHCGTCGGWQNHCFNGSA